MKDTLFSLFMNASMSLGSIGLARLPGAARAHSAISRALRPRGMRMIECQGSKMCVDAGDAGVGSHLVGLGVYEKRITGLLHELVRPGMTVFDIGANIGYYTLLFSRLVGSSGKVYAFEPEGANFTMLQRNVELNGLQNVFLVKKAASDRTGRSRLFLDKNNRGMHSLSMDNNAVNDGCVWVDTITLDDFMGEQRVKPDFVKMDIEGAEGLVLAGAHALLASGGVSIVMEYYPHHLRNFGTDPEGLLDTIRGYGYRMDVLERSKDGSGRANLLFTGD